ncbi:zinc finger protein Xfin-like isoform X1 [Neodiprion fabricii]|uniref:zinc finger protein Xfin-like isoform X1 n=1 Tax=Neodiprion fabricii TaxID=2872261 RepID=UPI001ED8F558|nr:zinc finger protein Xfin-like isoform X1 [Neodiprion fabricii]XP_046413219.1 zinc finger protein Xfin-like isoform X1 [Neodiprion fabricii]XP_046413220.1 zinc finger protein Xfin-like isoform X1 [Neodiprion fabricii]
MADSLPRLRALRPRPQPAVAAPPPTTGHPAKERNHEVNVEDEDEPMEQDQEREDTRRSKRGDVSDDEPTAMADEEEDEDDASAAVEDEEEEGEKEDVDEDGEEDDEEGKLVIKEEPTESPLVDTEEGSKAYECTTCRTVKKFPSLKSYLHHLKKEHKQRVRCYECPHCDFVCQHAKKLQRHFRVAHEDLQDKIATESAERSRCPMCAHVAVNQRDLETHQRVHHLKRRFFRCAKCSYVTHVRARYTKHVKYHSMPMIKCDACDFRTPYKWNLDRHTRNHGGGGAFQCRACNFTADIRQSLTVHEMNHHDPPVGQPHRKPNNPCERKPRNSPKRYNQVGASDFRENLTKTSGNSTPTKSVSPSKSVGTPRKSVTPEKHDFIDERNSVIADAECIALKCEEKGCQFITAWDSEMQRHLAESHAPLLISRSRKPLPMLIPLGTSSSPKSNNVGGSGGNTTLLRVPRVRVRPELAQIARDTEMARLYGEQENLATKRELSGSGDSFEKKNASFFDKLKERLMTSTSNNGGRSDGSMRGNGGAIDLKCWCTFEAKNMEELSNHRRTHHAALSVSLGSSRCPKCRRRCKSSADLQAHLHICQSGTEESSVNDNSQIYLEDRPTTTYRGEYRFPYQMDWDSSFTGLNSSGSSVESGSTQQSGRRVFKCPHCAFWASTASRFHVHIVGHLNRKPFECSLCSYRSNWRWDITKHIKLKAARDPEHAAARVLMTDETGRRNYSKYNKYLAQVQQQQLQLSDEHCIDEPPSKMMLTDESEYRQPPELTPAPNPVSIAFNSSLEVSTLPSRPPPPLKAANRNQGQSLLKSTPVSSVPTASTVLTISVPTTTTVVNNSEETKRTLWKCKRCNYRDSSKDAVLLHVKSHYETSIQISDDEKKVYGCGDCPFAASTAAALAAHRDHHRPNLGAIFKCYLCPFYVSTKAELLEHARLHGEELAAEHQRNIEAESLPAKRKFQRISSESKTKADDSSVEEITGVTSAASSDATSLRSKANVTGGVPPPLLLDTRALPDAPLVWVSRPDGTLTKMLKCRHCPHVASRRAEVRDHEGMHVSPPSQGLLINCTDCNFTCTRRDVMESHTAMHSGVLGTVHCLVDEGRPDNQQLNDLATLLGLAQPPVLGPEPDLRDSRLVHCCGKCPARFLCEKELRIHLRYHSTELAYSCQWCSYAARQPAHLLAHQKAHSPEYQERTRYLLSLYGHSQRHPPPTTACVEANNHSSSAAGIGGVAWIVVEINSSPNGGNSNENNQENGNQVFTCAKCPARYFKLDALEYHMTLHGKNNKFKCLECDYSSKTAQNLAKHQVVHRLRAESNETTAAPIANRVPPPPDPQFGILMRGNPNFVYPGYLRNGRLKEKRYKCHKCPSAFEKREQYRVHLTLHGAKQRYRCDTCDYSVKYYANYVQHLKKHQANAEAQASKRQLEDDTISVDSDVVAEPPVISVTRPGKSLSKPSVVTSATATTATTSSVNTSTIVVSNQDKQSLILMQRKGTLVGPNEADEESIRCPSCPFGTPDKDAMDAHKRRHGIERMTPPCPHCDYVPRKDENASDHVRLHFTRMYKPESYLIAELLALRVHPLKKTKTGRQEKSDEESEKLLFKECMDGRFLPAIDTMPLLPASPSTSTLALQEKVIVDPNTGEAKKSVST